MFGVFILLPSYDITKKLQAVIRYQHANSDGPDGITALKRYEQAAGGGTGDNLQRRLWWLELLFLRPQIQVDDRRRVLETQRWHQFRLGRLDRTSRRTNELVTILLPLLFR